MRDTLATKFAAVLLLAAFTFACWSVVSTRREIGEMYAAASTPNSDHTLWSVDVSPDQTQRELTIALALLLGVVAFRSRRAARTALITAGAVYLVLECFWLLFKPVPSFDRVTPIPHVLAGISLAAGVCLYRFDARWRLVAILAPAFAAADIVSWAFETAHGREEAGVAGVWPVAALSDVIAGGRWDHVLVLVLAIASVLAIAALGVGRCRGEV